jgi:hypothetical protein
MLAPCGANGVSGSLTDIITAMRGRKDDVRVYPDCPQPLLDGMLSTVICISDA